MTQGLKAVTRARALALVAGALWLGSCPAFAQASSAPPPLPAASASKPGTPAAVPRATIQLTPAERQAIDARAGSAGLASVDDELVPRADDMKPRTTADDASTTRIEQKRQSNRVSEVIVTPAGQSHSYVMTNREGRPSYSATQTNPGLSVPMFLRFEFGRPAPATNPSPPPAPPPPR